MDPKTPRESGIRIDYERLDVADIAGQIQSLAAARTSPAGPPAAGPAPEPPSPPPAGPPAPSAKDRMKGRLTRLLRPFYPLLRLLSLPLHEDLQAVLGQLHETNKRIDYLYQRLAERDQSKEYIKLLHLLDHNLVVELTKLRIEHDALKSKLRILEKDLDFLSRRERAVERRIPE